MVVVHHYRLRVNHRVGDQLILIGHVSSHEAVGIVPRDALGGKRGLD
jgi:hypothetical protein